METNRRPRADALRNREKLVAAAREAFDEGGIETSLERIAQRAGVGIGTLYRHFPSREELVAAVYASRLDELLGAVEPLTAQHGPSAALREFIGRYAGFVRAKRGLAESLRAGALREAATAAQTRERVNEAIGRLLRAGAADGSLRQDLDPDDVTSLLVGVFLSTQGRDDPAQIERLLDLVVAGLRP